MAQQLDRSATEAHYDSRLVTLAAELQRLNGELVERNKAVGNELEQWRQHNTSTLKYELPCP